MSNDLVVCADVQENLIVRMDKDLLAGLLMDRSTGKNIIWATSDYADLGEGYQENDEITIEAITGANGEIIKPRSVKSKEEQAQRVRNMAEVFTPLWICNKQNNLVDDEWFGRENVFNEEVDDGWISSVGKVQFPDYEQHSPKGWETYIGSKRLEITCGEAPYLVSRYDNVTGEEIPVSRRVGILDRKFRVINERVRNFKDHERTKHRWLELAMKAVRSTYGFEWSGDNLLLARENVLYTVIEYYKDKFDEDIAVENLLPFVEIISWNIWQMDGIKCVVPNSCHEYVKEHKAFTPNIFDTKAFSEKTLKRSLSFCDVNEDEIMKCQGCLKEDVFLHNGVYCKIKNWSTGKVMFFKDLMNGLGSDDNVGNKKDFKFDVVIGNPPYQQDTAGAGRQARPVYNLFVEQAKILSTKYIVMITPSRWFSGGMGLDAFRDSMVNDKRIKRIVDYTNAKDCFSNISIGGGVNYFIWEKNYNGECEFTNIKSGKTSTLKRSLNEYSTLVRYNEAITILRKIKLYKEMSLDKIISPLMPYGMNTSYRGFKNKTTDKNIKLYASNGITYISEEEITKGLESVYKYKVMVSKTSAEHAGEPSSDGRFRVIPSSMQVIAPGEVCTHSYFVIGSFDDKVYAQNVYSYLKTKFVRFLMLLCISGFGLSKIVFPFVPIQDFSKPWTDEELYEKYGLNDEEIAFIDSMIKPME